MDQKERTLMGVTMALFIIVVVWMIMTRRKNSAVPDVVPQYSDSGFYDPYNWLTPGVYPGSVNGNGPTFNATNTINVQTGQIAGLSNSYMPLFGLVGMTAVAG